MSVQVTAVFYDCMLVIVCVCETASLSDKVVLVTLQKRVLLLQLSEVQFMENEYICTLLVIYTCYVS